MVAFTPCAHKLPHAVGEVAANCEVTCTEPSTQVAFSLSEVPFGCLFEPHLWWVFGQTVFDVSLAAYFEPRRGGHLGMPLLKSSSSCFLFGRLEPLLWWAFDSSPDNLDG